MLLLINVLLLQAGWTALHCACYNGYTKVVEILLLKNADISATNKVSDKKYKICIIVSVLLESEVQLAKVLNYKLQFRYNLLISISLSLK